MNFNKAVAATTGAGGGTGLGWAVSTIIIALWWPDASDTVQQAINIIATTAVSALSAGAATYFTPSQPRS